MTKHTKADSEWDFSDPNQHPQTPYNKWWKDTIGKRIKYKFVREGWDRDIAEMATLEGAHSVIARMKQAPDLIEE